MKTTNVTDFRSNLKRYLDAVIQDSDCVVINRGNTGAVLISLDEFNSIKNTEAILRSDRLSAAVRQGIRDLENGNFEEVDIDSL